MLLLVSERKGRSTTYEHDLEINEWAKPARVVLYCRAFTSLRVADSNSLDWTQHTAHDFSRNLKQWFLAR